MKTLPKTIISILLAPLRLAAIVLWSIFLLLAVSFLIVAGGAR